MNTATSVSNTTASAQVYGVHFDNPIDLARYNMIQQQIRPWEVLDETVLNTLEKVKRELFVPAAHHALAFMDTEIPLVPHAKPDQFMLPPRVEARLLQELSLKSTDQVLEIGAGSGYMAAILAAHSAQVTTVEIDPTIAQFAQDNLQKTGITNVTVQRADGFALVNGKYDAIVISGAVAQLPQALLQQLNIGGRMAVISGKAPVMSAQIITRVDATTFDDAKIFECLVGYLQGGQPTSSFSF